MQNRPRVRAFWARTSGRGIDASNAPAFLAAGAAAVGIGSAIVRATPAERRAIVAAITSAPRP